jgi:hypothetical protein
MQLSNLSKILIVAAFAVLFVQGCGPAKTGNTAAAPPPDAQKTEPPYKNDDPEAFQTEIKVTTGAAVERFMAVRKGDKWRVDTDFGGPNHFISLRTDKDYVMSATAKIYSDYQSGHGFDERARMIGDITRGMLDTRVRAVFEKLTTEGSITKYRMWGEPNKNLVSIVSFDEKAGIPVRMEVFKNGGDGPADMTVELVGFKAEPDETLLVIPKDFKAVPLEEMRKFLIAAH